MLAKMVAQPRVAWGTMLWCHSQPSSALLLSYFYRLAMAAVHCTLFLEMSASYL